MTRIRNQIDATQPEEYAEAEASFYDCAMEMPEGYTRCGLAFTQQGPRLFVTGPDVPAMYWGGSEAQWQRVIPLDNPA